MQPAGQDEQSEGTPVAKPIAQTAADTITSDAALIEKAIEPENGTPRSGSRAFTRILLQVGGACVGIALLVWAIRLATSGENSQRIEVLRHAPIQKVAALMLLSATSLCVNGLMFNITLRPLKRIPTGETIAANWIATCLSVLPFKLSLIVRTLVHVRKHGVTWRQMGAWYAAFAGLTLGTVGIVVTLIVVRGEFDAVAAGIIAASLCAFMLVVHAGGMLIPAIAKGFPKFAVLSMGAEKIALSPAIVASHIALRVADLCTYGLRFWIAAGIVGVALTPAQGVQVGSTNMLLRAVAPAGTLGFTEAGTAFAGGLMGLAKETVALLALVCSAGEFVTALPLAIIAWIWLAPHRFVGKSPNDQTVARA